MEARPRALKWWLLATALISAIPRLYLGATQYIEYDGYWHVFIASQDNWHQFYKEYQSNFHPPLFYLLLKATIWFGRRPLVYRAISLLSGVGAVGVIGKIAEKLSFHCYTPVIAALAYGVALPAIIISCEVRSYMLCVLCILVSLYYFMDILREGGQSTSKTRVLFVLFTVLAGYSHYGAFLYIFACATTAIGFCFLLPCKDVWRRLARDAVMFGAIAAALAYVYLTHGRSHAVAAGHLSSYYFHPARESLWVFFTRNSRQLANSFLPVPVPSGLASDLAAIAVMLAAGGFVFGIRRRNSAEDIRAAVLALTTGTLFGGILAGGVFGKYPYGGELRQQFFLFPFLVLCGSVLFDRIAGSVSGKAVVVWYIAVSVVTTASWSFAFGRYPKEYRELGTVQMSHFRRDFPSPAAVYVDQFNLINFFIHYHDWRWHFVGQCPAAPAIDIYRVYRANQNFLLLRDSSRWNLSWGDSSLYQAMSICMRALSVPSLTIFYAPEHLQPDVIQREPIVAGALISGSESELLCVNKLRVDGSRIYADLVAHKCLPDIDYMQPCAKCDDTNWRINYTGHWVRGEFQPASHATLTYTDDPTAAAQFSFDGTELRYWYTKAFNRGLATIVIDGVTLRTLDLYSPTIEWQTSSVFSGLPPGHHTVEIQATGRHSPESTDSYIDLDALEGR